jgi:hypothetical protein
MTSTALSWRLHVAETRTFAPTSAMWSLPGGFRAHIADLVGSTRFRGGIFHG